MEPENLVLEQLKAIRAGIDGLRGDVQSNGRLIEVNTANLELVAGEINAIKMHLEWLRAQVSAAATQASVADTGRARLEDRLADVVRRLEALEGER